MGDHCSDDHAKTKYSCASVEHEKVAVVIDAKILLGWILVGCK